MINNGFNKKNIFYELKIAGNAGAEIFKKAFKSPFFRIF